MNNTTEIRPLPGPSVPFQILSAVADYGLWIALLVIAATLIYTTRRTVDRVRTYDSGFQIFTKKARWILRISCAALAIGLCAMFMTSFYFGSGLGITQ